MHSLPSRCARLKGSRQQDRDNGIAFYFHVFTFLLRPDQWREYLVPPTSPRHLIYTIYTPACLTIPSTAPQQD